MKKKDNKNIIPIIAIILIAIFVCLVFLFLNKKQDIYKFDFNDGYIPGTTYRGEINLTNGKVDFEIIPGCSLPNPEECPSNTDVKGTLTKEQLEIVKTSFEKNNRQDNAWILSGVSYMIQGNKICDEETNKTCAEIGKELVEFTVEK